MRVIDLATLSLTGGSGIAEAKIPLWSADGTTQATSQDVANSTFLFDGTAPFGTQNPANYSQSKIFTLSSNWSSSLKFAFEVTMYTNSASYTSYANLYDITASSEVTGSRISTTSTTATVIRSGNLTLIAGHVYGVSIWSSSTSGTNSFIDASLIVFPQ